MWNVHSKIHHVIHSLFRTCKSISVQPLITIFTALKAFQALELNDHTTLNYLVYGDKPISHLELCCDLAAGT